MCARYLLVMIFATQTVAAADGSSDHPRVSLAADPGALANQATPSEAGSGEPITKGSFGIGAILGKPTGISGKYYLDDNHAIQAAFGTTFGDAGWHGAADYLWHPWRLTSNEKYVMPVYFGAGMQLRRINIPESSVRAGPRGVLGTMLDFKHEPIDLFFETSMGPELRFSGTDKQWRFQFNLNVGARYYF